MDTSYLLLLLLAFFLPLMCHSMTWEGMVTFKTLFFQAGCIGIFVTWLIEGCLRKKRQIRISFLLIPLFVLVVCSALSATGALNPFVALRGTVEYGFYLLLAFLIIQVVDSEKKAVLLLLVIAGAGTVVSAFGLLEYASGYRLLDRARTAMVVSTLGNSIYCAQYLTPLVPVLFAFVLIFRKACWKTAVIACLMLNLIAIFLTFSKSGWILSIISSYMFFFLLLRREDVIVHRKRFLMFFSLILLTVLCVGALYVVFHIQRVPALLDKWHPRTYTGRIEIWAATIRLVLHTLPAGVGLGNYYAAIPPYLSSDFYRILPGQRVYHAHNDYLQLVAEAGLVALLSFLFILIIFFKAAFFRFRNELARDSAILLSGLLTGVMTMCLQSLFNMSLQLPATTFLFWTMVAVTVSLSAGTGSATITADMSRQVKRPVLLFTAGLLLTGMLILMFVTFTLTPFRAYTLSEEGKGALAVGDYPSAVASFKESLARDRTDSTTYFYLGNACRIQGAYKEALGYFMDTVRLDPYCLEAYRNIGNTLRRINMPSVARSYFETALDINPFSDEARFCVALTYSDEGRYDRATAVLNEIDRGWIHYEAVTHWLRKIEDRQRGNPGL